MGQLEISLEKDLDVSKRSDLEQQIKKLITFCSPNKQKGHFGGNRSVKIKELVFCFPFFWLKSNIGIEIEHL
jgi:hypothetical protein